jgi:hypothetical protein
MRAFMLPLEKKEEFLGKKFLKRKFDNSFFQNTACLQFNGILDAIPLPANCQQIKVLKLLNFTCLTLT